LASNFVGMLNQNNFLIFYAFLVLLATTFISSATKYYVDFDSGNDTNPGTSTNQAWQHCPGDINANGKALHTLHPADTVMFRGGVVYRGAVKINGSGTPGNPVTFQGNRWGTTNAIISGGNVVSTAWTQCTKTSDCWGNPNFSNIWWTTIPTAVTNTLNLFYCGNSILPFSQYPTPVDPINWGHWQSEWLVVGANNITTNALQDATVFVQTNADYWKNAWVVILEAGVLPDIVPITGFSPRSHQIQFHMHRPLPPAGTYYTVLNQPALINEVGQVAIRPDENRVYLWPPNSSDPNHQTIEYSAPARTISFWDTNNRSNIVLDGFKFVGAASALFVQSLTNAAVTNVVMQNCEITCSRAMLPHALAIYFDGNRASGGFTVSNCLVHDAQTCGITAAGINIQVLNSEVYHLSSYNFSGIYFLGVVNGLVSNNIVHGIYGVHCNGASSYGRGSLHGTNITFANNWIYDCPSVTCLSLQSTENVNIFNNILDGGGANSQVLSDYNGLTGNCNIINNTIVRSRNNLALYLNSPHPVITVVNNIIAGSTILTNEVRYNNIYCNLLWNQSPRYGWHLASGESVCASLDALFVNPTVMNWQLAPESPAIGAGKNVGGLFPELHAAFSGGVRPATGRWDVGAISSIYPTTPRPAPPADLPIWDVTQKH